MRLELPDYPVYPSATITPHPDVLEALVEGYRSDTPGTPDPMDFLLGAAPAAVFADVLTSPLPEIPAAGYLWIMHLSGYFGGVWLRRELISARPDNAIAGVSVVPDEAAFEAIAKGAAAALAAAAAPDAEVLGFVEERLEPLVDSYGYNQGYLLEILDRPPEGVEAPTGLVDCGGLLGCEYRGASLVGLSQLIAYGERLRASRGGGWADLADRLARVQDEADDRGRTVWSTGLSVQGFPETSYRRLVDLSIRFLQAVQATALAALEGFTTADVTLARRAALGAAMLAPWTESYRVGLLDGRAARRLPTFTGW